MKVNFPKYPRKKNLICKLSLNQILLIKKLYKRGLRIIDLSRKFNVCPKSIRYWLKSKEQRKAHNTRDRILFPRNYSKLKLNASSRKAIARKKLVMNKEFKDWQIKRRIIKSIKLRKEQIKLLRNKLNPPIAP